jgi:uncharacterized membrane protein
MSDDAPRKNPLSFNFQGNLIAGLLTIMPIIVVWFVFDFFLTTLSRAGHPLATALTEFIDRHIPAATPILADPAVQWFIAVLVALLLLYSIGAIASRVVGKQLIALFEKIIHRIPLVQSIYSATKQLVGVLQRQPDGTARVVLIDFPHKDMKAVGLVMRIFKDAQHGYDVASVFVPTSPNPTSGYLLMVPMDKTIPTTMTMDQAMTMIMSGGATAPDNISLGPKIPITPPPPL